MVILLFIALDASFCVCLGASSEVDSEVQVHLDRPAVIATGISKICAGSNSTVIVDLDISVVTNAVIFEVTNLSTNAVVVGWRSGVIRPVTGSRFRIWPSFFGFHVLSPETLDPASSLSVSYHGSRSITLEESVEVDISFCIAPLNDIAALDSPSYLDLTRLMISREYVVQWKATRSHSGHPLEAGSRDKKSPSSPPR